MSGLAQDARYALRQLRRNPGFAAIAVITLGLGIGANTTMFSVIRAVLLRPLAIKDPARVFCLQEHWRDMFGGLSVGNFADVQQQAHSFASLGASGNASFNLATQDAPERVQGEIATATYLSTFGVQPIAGRVFTPDEDRPGHAQVAVISERLWRSHFQGDSRSVGQTIRLNGLSYTVIGVMPKSFDPLLENSDLWVPAAYTAQQLAEHDDHYLNVVGRLKPGVTLAAAESEMKVTAQRLQQQFPIEDKERDLYLSPLATVLLGDQKPMLWMLLASVGLLLLIACANIANLQLARARTRKKEIAVRAALGASAKRIARQLLIESMVLGIAGGVAGVLLAYQGVAWIVAHGPASVPRLDQSGVDGFALAFACAATLISGVLFGLAPALRAASMGLSEAIKEGVGTLSVSRDRLQSLLAVGEIALALVLMTSAGLLIRSALLVLRLNPGFDAANLVVGRVGLPDAKYHDPGAARETFERMIDAASTLPGVESSAVVSRVPLGEGWSGNGLIAEGRPLDPSSLVSAISQFVSPSYLSTIHIPLRAGRNFTAQDTRDKTLVTIVNETLARTMWPGENPIGKRFACCEDHGPRERMTPVWHEVVGVVSDVRLRGLDVDVQPTFYIPVAQMPPSAWDWLGRTMDLVVRTRGGAFPANDLRTVVATIAPGVPIYQLSTMQEKMARALEASHFDTFLLSLFAGIALVLASVGIYGVLSHVFSQRTRDIGLRMALGATRGQIAGHVLGSGLRLIVPGIALGVAGALASARLVSSLLYGVGATDSVTFFVASGILAVVALVASYIPARRAMQVDPMVALRYE
jgi:putative ABC transport system permease protein